MVFGFGVRRNTTNNIPGYSKLKVNARRFVNQYYATPNKTQTTNINAAWVRNVHNFLKANPRGLAAGAAAANAAMAKGANGAQAGAAAAGAAATPSTAPPAEVGARAGRAAENAGASNAAATAAAAAAAASAAGNSGRNQGGAAAAAAAAVANNAKNALKAINWTALTTNQRNSAIRNLRSKFPQNKWNTMTNNGLNQPTLKQILAMLKTQPPPLPPRPSQPNLINLSNQPPAMGPVSSNGPATVFGLEWASNANKKRNIYAKNMGSKNYYARKNGSNNYYRVINDARGKKIFNPTNKSAYIWNKNTKNFTKKVGGSNTNNLGLSGAMQQTAANIRSQRGSNRGSSVGSVAGSVNGNNNNSKN